MDKQTTLHLDIVSAEAEVFSGKAQCVFLTGTLGDLEITPGHAALLTGVLPGPVTIRDAQGKEVVVYVTGGILEVQPDVTTVLADTVVRAPDLNEAEAVKAQEQAKKVLETRHANVDYAKARAELIRAAAMLRTIREAKKKRGS